ncbi:Nucleotide-binding universal stress protein, UspA family [Actinopolyspora mzabensis]|uniref:Nucleotide-binding universal stress protein, UspA family n=1 Tax=Actinopolyspora mzabensis TaxID=995066 RepID=A0A1G8XYN2_ACTMZ|nr:universal stress protein [Actinopolyspora mzabensis]SDJ95304.1 Nucleotide-binding universal stress protein, UspA family [Actinopolyspora mzabensis]
MSPGGGASRTVVVGVDGSDASTDAVRWAASVASWRNARLWLVHVFRPAAAGHRPEEHAGAGTPHDAEHILSFAASAAGEIVADLPVSTRSVHGRAVPALLAETQHAGLLVLGASGRGGFAGMLIGSTAAAVLSRAACPVVVVRSRPGAEHFPAEGSVVVGIDGSPISERALAAAFDYAAHWHTTLVAVHAWSDVEYDTSASPDATDEGYAESGERLLAERLAGWRQRYPDVSVRRVVGKDRPRQQLLRGSETARLVVLGSRGRGGFRGLLLGSTSQALIEHSHCPVLVIRPLREEW